jgi:hypothetical protein
VHPRIRRLFALFGPAIPLAFVGLIAGAEATWGAARSRPEPRLQGRAFTASPLVTEARRDERAESAVVLVVLDGVRWQEVFYGADRSLARVHGLNPLAWVNPRDLMPNIHRLVQTQGVAIGAPGHGAQISASGPQFISLPGYLEIFAGKPDLVCDRNDCARPPARTIADQVRDASGPDDVALVASWPNIARAASADVSGFVVTAGRTLVERAAVLQADPALARLLEHGAAAPAWPGEGQYRPDGFTAKIALRYLETNRPRFLFVGLGDADEYGHRDDYAAYLEAVHQADTFVGDLVEVLGRMGARGRHTTVIVTADHGRAYDFKDHGPQFPESGRVWLTAFGADLKAQGLAVAAHRYTLSDVAPTVRSLLGMTEGSGEPIAEIVRDVAD